MSQQENEVIWVVVLVQSGIPTLAEAYSDQEQASAREKFLRQEMRPDYDEVGLFDIIIDEPPDELI
jgi:hypothetical protein